MCAVLTLCLSKPSIFTLTDSNLEDDCKLVQAVGRESQLFKLWTQGFLKTVNIFMLNGMRRLKEVSHFG